MISKSKLFPKGHWCHFLSQSSISIWWLFIWQAWCGEGCWLWCPRASNIIDDQVYPCCGLFKLEKWEVCYHNCVDIIQPYRWQLLESETSFCDTCHKNCTSPADFILHQECVHLCLPLFVCPICHFTYITRSCLRMHITEFHGGLEKAISLI